MLPLTPLARELLAGPHFAVVATMNPDGGIQQSVVWVKERDGRVVFSTVLSRAKYRNLVRDPRVSVTVTDDENGYRFSAIRGTAEMDHETGAALIDELSRDYTGQAWVETQTSPRVTVVVTPEHITEH